MSRYLVVSMALLLAACSGEDGRGGGGPGDLAASACRAAAEARLEGKLFELDLAVLAASMKAAPNGEKFLTAPITIEPGLTSQTKQIVECTVRFTGERADVVGFVFNW